MSKKKSKFYLKVHNSIKGRVVSICDENLINKKIEDKKLNLIINEKFYKGDLVEEEIVLDYIKNERNVNLVGENIINLCIDKNIIDKEQVILIEKVPVTYIIAL